MAHSRYIYMYDKLLNVGIKGDEFVLDCACGKGLGSKTLLDKGMKVVACDIEEDLVKKTIGMGIEAKVGNICTLDYPDDFVDVFLCSETLEHLDRKEIKLAVSEITRVCKDGGYICLTVPEDKKKCLENKKHKQYIDRERLLELFYNCDKLFEGVFCKSKNRCNLVLILENGKDV